MIRVSELTKRFGPTVAVDQLSFEIERGEVVGFLGPNGAGKTTTIRVLTGYHPASSGTAEVAGFDVQTQSLEVRRNIGYLPQEVPIYPDLRVIEYLRYRAELKGVPARERAGAVSRAMAKAGIEDVARRLVGQVSQASCHAKHADAAASTQFALIHRLLPSIQELGAQAGMESELGAA